MFAKIYKILQEINKSIDKGEVYFRDWNTTGLKLIFVYRGMVVAEKEFESGQQAFDWLNNTGNQTTEGLLARMGHEKYQN